MAVVWYWLTLIGAGQLAEGSRRQEKLESEQQMPKKEEVEIRYQQILQPDGSVFSAQSLSFPSSCRDAVTTEAMLDSYLIHVRRTTHSLVRPVADGSGIRFTLFGLPVALLRFAPPQRIAGAGREELRLQITGGVLVQREESHSGTFSFIISRVAGGVQVAVELADYCPMLLGSRHPSIFRRVLYQLTQARIHMSTGVKYLSTLYRDVTGHEAIPRKVKVSLRPGKEI
jgi:hypothetical protein